MNLNREILGEILLIVGGFILAETIVKQFLTLSQGALQWWILPLLSLGFIFGAIGLKKGENKIGSGLLNLLFLSLVVIFLVLVKKDILSGVLFVWLTLLTLIIWIIFSMVEIFSKKNKKFKKKSKK